MATTTELEPLRVESIPAQPSPLQNEVTCIEGGIEDDCRITFKCNNKLFVILLSIQSPVDSIERNYLERLNGPLEKRDEEKTDEIFEELGDFLAGLCQPVFRKFAAIAPESIHLRPTLYNLLHLEVLQLRLITTTKGPAILQLQDGPQISAPNSFRNENLNIPIFKPSEIEVLDILKRDTVFKALVQGSTICAKVIGHQNSTRPIQREISSLKRMSEAKLDPRLRTPALLGLISSDNDFGLILGFLMEYIECGPLVPDLFSLEINTIPRTRREAWAKQISDDLGRLHGIGLVWGDAKAGNIIIDKESNPWIIDFGGGYTDDWIDADLVDSVMGGSQGLRKTLKFLQLPDQIYEACSRP